LNDTLVARRTVLITGASSGIGEAFADVFAAEGFDVVAVARRQDRLQSVAARLREHYKVTAHVVVADLGLPDASARLCAEVADRGITVDALVNNAGYGVPLGYLAQPWDRHQTMLQLMTVCVAELTYRLLPGMVERGYGRVINVASLAGLVPAPPGHTLYPATKAFLIKFSEALHGEVRTRGVHVSALCPGFTLSEFHDVTGTRDTVSRLPTWLWSEAATVARAGYEAVNRGEPIHVPGRVNRAIATLVNIVPMPIVLAVSRRLARSHRKL
jgi:short-subunit dehydrogenase